MRFRSAENNRKAHSEEIFARRTQREIREVIPQDTIGGQYRKAIPEGNIGRAGSRMNMNVDRDERTNLIRIPNNRLFFQTVFLSAFVLPFCYGKSIAAAGVVSWESVAKIWCRFVWMLSGIMLLSSLFSVLIVSLMRLHVLALTFCRTRYCGSCKRVSSAAVAYSREVRRWSVLSVCDFDGARVAAFGGLISMCECGHG